MDAFGSPDRLRAATGWQPEIGLDRTLADVLSGGGADRSQVHG